MILILTKKRSEGERGDTIGDDSWYTHPVWSKETSRRQGM